MNGLTGTARRRRLTRSTGIAVLALLGLLMLAVSPLLTPTAAAQDASDWSAPRTVYIPDTGQSIDGVFLDFWRNGGGVEAYGNPITPELKEDGHVVQYYDYARFEYWPDDPNGNVVHLGDIGTELRPHVVFRRTTDLGKTTTPESSAIQAAQVAAAWLPLGTSAAKRADTDTWRYVAATKHSIQFGFKQFWEATGEADFLGDPITQEYVLDGTTYQVFERGELAWRHGKDPWMVQVGDLLAKRFKLDTAPTDQGDIPTYSEDLFVPPAPPAPDPNGERWIEVNLSAQYMIAWQGDTSVIESYVSTGVAGHETPTGTFYVLTKYVTDEMIGGSGADYYDLPDVPWVMHFTDNGDALHGTYWHSNFGTPMSHGCVNLPTDVAAFLYDWASVGTRVEIHY